MKLNKIWAAAGAAAVLSCAPFSAYAAPAEYVRVCDAFGTGFSYIPGTDTCVKVATGETKQDTENGVVTGKTPLAQSVDDANAAVAAQQQQLNSMSGTSASQQQQLDALSSTTANLQISNAALQDRINQAFEEIEKANEGNAVMAALPTPFIESGHHFALAGNFAQFESNGAFGLAGAVRATNNLTFNAGVAVGAQQSTVGGRVGFNVSW